MIAKAFVIGLWACIGLVLVFLATPWLINQRNDGLIILAPLLLFGYGAVTYVLWNELKEDDNEEA